MEPECDVRPVRFANAVEGLAEAVRLGPAFAGLWESWHHGKLAVESCTISTTTANPRLQDLHTLMPAIAEPADYLRWLEGGEDRGSLRRLPPPYPVDKMELHPVSTLVNSPHHEAPKGVGKGRAGSIRAGRQIPAPGDCAHGPLALLSGPIGLERSPQISIFLSPHGPGRYATTARASRKTMLANAFERGPLNRMGANSCHVPWAVPTLFFCPPKVR